MKNASRNPQGEDVKLSIVIEVYNESEALPVSIDRLMKLRDIPDNFTLKAESIMIDDGSTDGSNG